MSDNSLPNEYKGYSTAELLQLWASIPDRTLEDEPVPKDMISAMRDLLYEYRLLDFGRGDGEPEKIRCSKQYMAPFGIDPAPWADENGIRNAELKAIWSAKLMREKEERRVRNRAKRLKARGILEE